jgi:hypothetical protein
MLRAWERQYAGLLLLTLSYQFVIMTAYATLNHRNWPAAAPQMRLYR